MGAVKVLFQPCYGAQRTNHPEAAAYRDRAFATILCARTRTQRGASSRRGSRCIGRHGRLSLASRLGRHAFGWQAIGQIQARDPDTAVRHAVVGVESVRQTQIVPPIDAGGKDNIGDRSTAFPR
jgi:hypothetical protein